MIKELVKEHLSIELTDKQEQQFLNYYELLVAYNEHTNLTAITKKEDVYLKHFLDSLYLIKCYDFSKENLSFCDMGSGAGFPSIPIKIVFPKIKVTIVDSLGKRIKFLDELIKQIGLENVTLVHNRAEVFAKENNLKFDVVTARALGHLKLILEMGIPLLKVNGMFLAMKSMNVLEELEESKNAIKTLSVKIVNKQEYKLTETSDSRFIFGIEKTKHVKGYPRSFANMKKKPL